MAFPSYRALIGPLVLPYDEGTEFTIAPISAEWGTRFRLAAEGQKVPEVDKLSREDELRLFLGDAFDEMRTAKMPHSFIDRAFLAALAEFRGGRDEAERVWTLGEDSNLGKALKAAAEMAAASPGSTRSPSSGAARSRGSRAGTSGTTSRPGTPRRAPRKTAKASAGPRSSGKGAS